MQISLASALIFAISGALMSAAEIKTDIEYGSAGGERLLLDACVPDGSGPFPAVILVHGGGWSAGDKSGGPRKGYMAPMHDPLTAAGFAWFSINYRLAPKHRYPAALEDVETAIRWVKSHAAEFRIAPDRLAISGESAGGHLAALAVMRAQPDTQVAAVVAFYTPFDLAGRAATTRTVSENVGRLLGVTTYDDAAVATMRAASPFTYVHRGLPPFLLVQGEEDKGVPLNQSVSMQAALRAVDVKCDLITIPGGGHGMLDWEPLAPGFKQRVTEWLQQALAR